MSPGDFTQAADTFFADNWNIFIYIYGIEHTELFLPHDSTIVSNNSSYPPSALFACV